MDMDSTLITIECIDEIADMQGIKPRGGGDHRGAMRGEIDFAESLARRVALLAGLPVGALERVYDERLRLSPGAERMLAGFAAVGAKTLLVSGGFTFFTDRLQARLGLDETPSNTLEIADGRLTGRRRPPIVDARGEGRALRRDAASGMRGADGIAIAIGDGANDLPMLHAADVSIAYRAKPVVRAQATHAIDHCGLDAVLNLFVGVRRGCDRPRSRERRAARPRPARSDRERRRTSSIASSIHAIWIASRIFSPLRFGSSSNPGSAQHPALQVGEADGARVDVRMRFGERDRDLARIGPFHRLSASPSRS